MNKLTTQLTVLALLEEYKTQHPLRHWSVQGFGMMRLYLSKKVRLHIWHSSLRVPGVSDIHSHPWDFWSNVICGRIRDTTYNAHMMADNKKLFCFQEIQCGAGAKLLGEPTGCYLVPRNILEYEGGKQYGNPASLLHSTEFTDGTVTIVERQFKDGANPDVAHVVYPGNQRWVSAEPRKATKDEEEFVIKCAIELLKKEIDAA